MATDAIEMLKSDHRMFIESFRRTKGMSAKIEQLALRISQALAVHAEMEEKIFYPAVGERAKNKSDKRDTTLVSHAIDEHASVKQLLLELAAQRDDERAMKLTLWKMEKAVRLHVAEEEQILFPGARRLFAPDELMRLGSEMEQIKAHLPAA